MEASKSFDINLIFLIQYKYDAFHDTKIDLRRIKKQLNDDQSVLLTLPPDSLSDLNSDHDADVLFLGEMQMMKNFLDDLVSRKDYSDEFVMKINVVYLKHCCFASERTMKKQCIVHPVIMLC